MKIDFGRKLLKETTGVKNPNISFLTEKKSRVPISAINLHLRRFPKVPSLFGLSFFACFLNLSIFVCVSDIRDTFLAHQIPGKLHAFVQLL